jgi:hypothetical protein
MEGQEVIHLKAMMLLMMMMMIIIVIIIIIIIITKTILLKLTEVPRHILTPFDFIINRSTG